MPGEIGVTGFKTVAIGERGEEFVGVTIGDDAATGAMEIEGFHGCDAAKHRVAISGAGDDGNVAGAGVLSFGRETVGVDEMGVVSAQFAGETIHFKGKSGVGTGVVAGEGAGGVVATFYEQSFEEGHAGVAFAGFDIYFCGFAKGVVFGDGNGCEEIAVADDDECGEKFLSAGGGLAESGIFFVKNGPRAGVDGEGAAGKNNRTLGSCGGVTGDD